MDPLKSNAETDQELSSPMVKMEQMVKMEPTETMGTMEEMESHVPSMKFQVLERW